MDMARGYPMTKPALDATVTLLSPLPTTRKKIS
jgi:hypothetical protein